MGIRFGGELDQSVEGRLYRLEKKVNSLDVWQLIILVMFLAMAFFGCAMTTGDPYGDGVPCYEGPLIIEKVTPTPTPNTEGESK